MSTALKAPGAWHSVGQRLSGLFPGKKKPAATVPAATGSSRDPDGGRVPLAKIAVKRIAVPVDQATPAQKRAAVRPSAGTHIPRSTPKAATSAPKRRTLAEMEAELSQLSDEEFLRSHIDDDALFGNDGPLNEPAAAALPDWARTDVREKPRARKAAASKPAAKQKPAAKEDGRFYPGDQAFLVGVKEAQLAESSPRAMWALYLLLVAVVTGLTWASVAKVDIITRADGKVVPEAREQVISSLEGGILRALHVREGAQVEAGQDLVQLDPTRFAAQQNEGQAKQLALKGSVARLTAEAYGRPLVFPPDVRLDGAIVGAETEAYNARRRSLDEAISVTRRSMGLLENELETAQRMSAQGLMSDVEVMRLRRQRNDMLLQIQERSNRFRQDASTDLAKARTELVQLDEQQVVKEDALKRTTLKSPVRGIVKNIRSGTVGGVIGPGAAILEIVPLGERVLVEARIKPADIGFVHVGQHAEVKLSAYDYATYGGLSGTVEYISPDALGDERVGAQDSTYYRARIRTDASKLRGRNDALLQVLPGMVATVEVRTGDRTVMDFMLKPLLKSREAFTEH